MSLSDFKMLLVWAKKQKIKRVLFTGGEPTGHSKFEEILEVCRKNNILCYMASNCAYPDNINNIIAVNIKVIFVNCSTEYASGHMQELINKLDILRKNKVKLVLRVNVVGAEDNLEGVLSLAKKVKARIRIGITNPAIYSEGYLSVDRVKELVNKIDKLAGKCLKNNIYIYLAKPVPRCAFSDKDWGALRKSILIKSKCFVGYRGNFSSRIVVNPDLSVFGCFNNANKLNNILQMKDLREINRFYGDIFAKAAKKCLLNLSDDCKYSNNKECYGVCFSYVK